MNGGYVPLVAPSCPTSWAACTQSKLATLSLSPSKMKETCTRASAYYLLGSGVSPAYQVDRDFGHAFGAATAALAQHVTKPPHARLGIALASTPYFFDLYGDRAGKNIDSLMEVVCMADPILYNMYSAGWRFAGTEEKVILTVVNEHGDVEAKLSGTYDLKLERQDEVVIIDAKAVSSDYRYSWLTDPQVVYYLWLSSLQDRAAGVRRTYNTGNSGYLVAKVTPSSMGVQFINSMLRLDINFRQYVLAMIARYKTFVKLLESTGPEAVYDIPGDLYHCSKGNFNCVHLNRCFGTQPIWLDLYEDDRNPTNVTHITLQSHELFTDTELRSSVRTNVPRKPKQVNVATVAQPAVPAISDSLLSLFGGVKQSKPDFGGLFQ